MSLQVTRDTLRKDVARYLGYDRDSENWSESEAEDVDAVISIGLRQFYRPTRLPGEKYSHQWSFLRPLGQMLLVAEVGDYAMPEDFADLDGDLFYVSQDYAPRRVRQVNEGRILELRQRDWYTTTSSYPQEAAILPLLGDGTTEQRYQLKIWPLPDSAYTLTFRYYARQMDLTCETSVPLGGREHAETIRASCLAAAESFLDDARGVKYEDYLVQLQGSVDFDRRANTPSTIGYNGDDSDRKYDPYVRVPRLIIYDKYPLP